MAGPRCGPWLHVFTPSPSSKGKGKGPGPPTVGATAVPSTSHWSEGVKWSGLWMWSAWIWLLPPPLATLCWRPWPSYVIPLCLSVLICKNGNNNSDFLLELLD